MKSRQSGLTLIELVTAMLVMAILVGLAVPSFRQFAQDSRTQAASSDLTTALAIARSEAIRGSTRAIACASSDGSTCSGSRDWTAGWLVFADRNNNDTPNVGEVVQVWAALGGQVSATADVPRVTYTGMGMALTTATFTVAGANCVGDRVRESTLGLSGSLQTRKRTCP